MLIPYLTLLQNVNILQNKSKQHIYLKKMHTSSSVNQCQSQHLT